MTRIGRAVLLMAVAVVATGSGRATEVTPPAPPDARAAFERLKGLAGEWKGHVVSKDGPEASVRWELISHGTAVMETLFPGTDHEMRSVYHLDGPALVLTHYCAMGNQPHMRLAASSTPGELVFRFDGGTNLDPAKDTHVHDGRIRFVDADHLEAEWTVHRGGQQAGSNRFFLARAPRS